MRITTLTKLSPVIVGLALLASCARPIQYTLVKNNVTQSQLIQDEKLLRDTSGVKQVITRIDSTNGVTLELYLKEGATEKGLQVATDLGYQQVRN
jgi:hypothetical protein